MEVFSCTVDRKNSDSLLYQELIRANICKTNYNPTSHTIEIKIPLIYTDHHISKFGNIYYCNYYENDRLRIISGNHNEILILDKFGNKLSIKSASLGEDVHKIIARELLIHDSTPLIIFEDMIGTKIYATMFAMIFNGWFPESLLVEIKLDALDIFYNGELLMKYTNFRALSRKTFEDIAFEILYRTRKREYISEDLYFPATHIKRAK
jgi:hypothetical protein